ncbi:caspase family protein [Bacteroidaceae bacterium HV4-6-C5C]|nr:caspase family protein [Bacteroidaceae bacterium HV4-6-C5C]
MKRIALLIGNSNGLPGVKKDISNWTRFLLSDEGGQWENSEIITKMNPARRELLSLIDTLKNTYYDFCYVIFSGHGAYKKGTILEINGNDEIIHEDDLIGIARRQISVFDCCRNILIEKSIDSEIIMRMYNQGGPMRRNIRPYYEKRIMSSIEQQVRLYACSINESALDSENGGIYTKNLLDSSMHISGSFKVVGVAHEEAQALTTKEAHGLQHQQTPIASLPRCFTSQQLIISINPSGYFD